MNSFVLGKTLTLRKVPLSNNEKLSMSTILADESSSRMSLSHFLSYLRFFFYESLSFMLNILESKFCLQRVFSPQRQQAHGV